MTWTLALVIASCVVLIAANIHNFMTMRKKRRSLDKIIKELDAMERELDEQDGVLDEWERREKFMNR